MVALNSQPTNAPTGGWGLIPVDLICDPKIKDGAVRLYGFLAERCYDANKRDRNILTRKEIARILEISESTVTNRVRELVERDWLLVWEVGRSNAYMTFKTKQECRETREQHPDRAYVIFDKAPDLRVARVNVDRGNQLPHSQKTKRALSKKPVQPVALTEVTSSLSSDNQLPHSKHVSLIQIEDKEINTDGTNVPSPADAGRGDQPIQSHVMVLEHIADADTMVEAESQTDGVLVESIKTPKEKVPAKRKPPTPRPPQPHIAPLEAWFDVFSDVKPDDVDIYSSAFCGHGKKQAASISEGKLTIAELREASHLARAWYDNMHTVSPLNISWEIGGVIAMQRGFLRAYREGFTAEDVMHTMEALKRGFWSDKFISHSICVSNLPTVIKRVKEQAAPDYSAAAEWRYDDSAN